MTINKQIRLLNQPSKIASKAQEALPSVSNKPLLKKALEDTSSQSHARFSVNTSDRKTFSQSPAGSKPTAPQTQASKRTQAYRPQRHSGYDAEFAGIRTGLSARSGAPTDFGFKNLATLNVLSRNAGKPEQNEDPWAEHRAQIKAARQERIETTRKKSPERLSKSQRRMLEEDGFNNDI